MEVIDFTPGGNGESLTPLVEQSAVKEDRILEPSNTMFVNRGKTVLPSSSKLETVFSHYFLENGDKMVSPSFFKFKENRDKMVLPSFSKSMEKWTSLALQLFQNEKRIRVEIEICRLSTLSLTPNYKSMEKLTSLALQLLQKEKRIMVKIETCRRSTLSLTPNKLKYT